MILWWKLRQLKSSRWEVRAEAVRQLGASRQRGAVPALVQALRDEQPGVRLEAIRAIGAIGHPAGIEPLAQALAAASKALADIGTPALEELLQALDSGDATVEKLAAAALGEIGSPQAAAALARTIAKNHHASASYLEPLEAARAAANALERILQRFPDRITKRDLEEIASVPDAMAALPVGDNETPQPTRTSVDCSRIRDLACQALARRPGRE